MTSNRGGQSGKSLQDTHAGKAKDGTRAEDVTQASHTQHGTVTHSTKHCAGGQTKAHILVLDCELTQRDRNHVANDHHNRHLRTPLKSRHGSR